MDGLPLASTNMRAPKKKHRTKRRKAVFKSEPRPVSVFTSLPPFADPESQTINVIVETPQGSRCKFRFDVEDGIFSVGTMLPAGCVFPFDFGYVPSTKGGDGDPLDVLLLMDVPAFCGCRIKARLVGVVEVEQTEDRSTQRNDFLVAVAIEGHDYQEVQSLKEVNARLLTEIEQFFVSYHEQQGKKYRVLARRGPKRAMTLLQRAIRGANATDE